MNKKSDLRIFLGNTYYQSGASLRRLILSIRFYGYNGFLTHFPSYWVRTFYLRYILNIKIGRNTSIHMGCFFSGRNVEIGNNTIRCCLSPRFRAHIIIFFSSGGILLLWYCFAHFIACVSIHPIGIPIIKPITVFFIDFPRSNPSLISSRVEHFPITPCQL